MTARNDRGRFTADDDAKMISPRPKYLAAGKRLAVEASVWLPGWHTSASPRNGNSTAEAQWCQWVHLARLILADPYTAATVPDLAVAYPDPPLLYDGCHPSCTGCRDDDGPS